MKNLDLIIFPYSPKNLSLINALMNYIYSILGYIITISLSSFLSLPCCPKRGHTGEGKSKVNEYYLHQHFFSDLYDL